MKVKLLKRVRKHWKIYISKYTVYTYLAYRDGVHIYQGNQLNDIKKKIVIAEAIRAMGEDTYKKCELQKEGNRIKRSLIQVYPKI